MKRRARKTGLTRDEALIMLKDAPCSPNPWLHNPVLTEAQVLDIARGAVLEQPDDDYPLKPWLASMVREVATSRKQQPENCEHQLPLSCCKVCWSKRKAQERVTEGAG